MNKNLLRSVSLAAALIVFASVPESGYGQHEVVNGTPPPSSNIRSNDDKSQDAWVGYDSPPISDPAEFERRQRISSRYDNRQLVLRTVEAEYSVHTISCGYREPLLPVKKSALIFVGEVLKAKVFLSNDKSGVYTEFTLRVDDVLKNTDKLKPATVVTDRDGGVVAYPNGFKVPYESGNAKLYVPATKYLFFLATDDKSPNFKVLTSYDLSSSTSWSMEEGGWTFETFKTMHEHLKSLTRSSFVEMVRELISQKDMCTDNNEHKCFQIFVEKHGPFVRN